MSLFLRFSSFFGMYSMDNNQRKRAHIMNFNYNDTNSWSYRKLTITEEWQTYNANIQQNPTSDLKTRSLKAM